MLTKRLREEVCRRCTPNCRAIIWSPGRAATSAGATRKPAWSSSSRAASSFERPDAGEHGRRGCGRQDRRRRLQAVVGHGLALLHLPRRCRTSTASCIPTRATRRPSPRSAAPFPCVTDGDGRRVRRADPVRRLRADRRRGDRRRWWSIRCKDSRSPACLLQNHGVFTVGKNAEKARQSRRS